VTPLESLDGASNGARGLISNGVNEQEIVDNYRAFWLDPDLARLNWCLIDVASANRSIGRAFGSIGSIIHCQNRE